MKREILIAGKWIAVKKSEIQPSGWLHWETADGTTGLSPPAKWHEREDRDPGGEVPKNGDLILVNTVKEPSK